MTIESEAKHIASIENELGPECAEIMRKEYERIRRSDERRTGCHGGTPNGMVSRNECPNCAERHNLVYYFEHPECWDALQKYLAIVDRRANQPNCQDCQAVLYWRGYWTADGYRCPACWAAHRREQHNEAARHRYKYRNCRYEIVFEGVVIKPEHPNCKHCGEEFRAKRSDAKFCSAKCRVAAGRAKTVKKKATKKRRIAADRAQAK